MGVSASRNLPYALTSSADSGARPALPRGGRAASRHLPYALASSADSGAPPSISRASWSVEGPSTLSEVWIVGLYQYIYACPPSQKDQGSNVPEATNSETLAEALAIVARPMPPGGGR